MNDPYAYEDPFRPIYERYIIAGWALGAVLALVAGWIAPYPTEPFVAFAGLAVVMGGKRIAPALRLKARKMRLNGAMITLMTIDDVKAKMTEHPGKLWLGYGFTWSQNEAQMVYDITRADPERLVPRQDERQGRVWLHGVGPEEEPLTIPLADTAGHMLLAGTTRAGKTVCLRSIIAQAVLRGEPVIIIDPKGDRDMAALAESACRMAGRPEAYVYFHPAHPEKSWRLDPMMNFNRPTELATRVAALIPGSSGMDPFSAYGQMTLNNIVNGLLLCSEKPNLILLRRFIEGGPEGVLIKAVVAYLEKKGLDYDEGLRQYINAAKAGDIGAKAQAHVLYYREKVQERYPSMEIEGLIGLFQHNRDHFGKMIASLMPILNMLTASSLGRLLSPDAFDMDDKRLITDFGRIINNCQVAYVGLDSLSDTMVGQAIGSMMLADLTAVAGDRYNYEPDNPPVWIIVDEAAETICDPFIAALNKGAGAGFRAVVATQTFGDFEARVGNKAKARMILGNLNNVVALRIIDQETQEYIVKGLPKTVVRHIEHGTAMRGETDAPHVFSATQTESRKEKEVPLVEPAVLGCLPNIEFFARLSAGRIVKGRLPILVESKAA